MLKFYVINQRTGYTSKLYDTYAAAFKRCSEDLQMDALKNDKLEIVAKIAEVTRAPHPVQIKLSQVFYDA